MRRRALNRAVDPCTPIEEEEIVRAEGTLGSFVGAARDEVVHGTYRREGTWAPELLDLLATDLLATGGTLLDIGANIGLVAVPATEKCPIRTFAFEPDPRNAELLARNIGLHGLGERIEIHAKALWSEAGALRLRRDPRNHGDQRLLPQGTSDQAHRQVPLARLDSLVEAEQLAGPVVAKIDTQGAEVDVLQGAGDLLEHIDYAIVEVWPAGLRRLNRNLGELVEILDGSFGWGRLLLEGESIWPLNELREEFDRLNAVTNLEDENTFFDLLVARHATARR